MKTHTGTIAVVGALGVLLTLCATSAPAQGSYYHQDLNSPAARALRQEIMNRAIIKQATGRKSTTSRRSTARRKTVHRKAAIRKAK